MRRLVALPLLATLLAAVLPAAPAAACSVLAPDLVVSSEVIGAGTSVRVSGADHDGPDSGCGALPGFPVPPTGEPTEEPSEEPSEEPTETGEPVETPAETVSADPSGTPAETVPATPAETGTPVETSVELVNVGYARPAPLGPVRIWLVDAARYDADRDPEAGRLLGLADVTTSTPFPGARVTRYSFATTVTVPADVVPGYYVVVARSLLHDYGVQGVRVVPALPETGSPSGELVRTAVLLLLAGAGAVALGLRPRRPLGAHARR